MRRRKQEKSFFVLKKKLKNKSPTIYRSFLTQSVITLPKEKQEQRQASGHWPFLLGLGEEGVPPHPKAVGNLWLLLALEVGRRSGRKKERQRESSAP